jgi:tetratricopeptide (TPR) repeat protein
MLKFIVILVLITTASAAPLAAKQLSQDDEVMAIALKGQNLIFAREYDKAMALFDELVEKYPASPAGYFGQMATLEVQMIEREDTRYAKEFKAAAKKGLEKVSGVMQLYHPSEWKLFISASLLGLDAFFKAREGKWWDSYTEGTESRQTFARIKKANPQFVDADFGLGMYLFWRSVFTRDLWFLKFFSDKRNEGIIIVEGVAKNGHFAKILAEINLGIMYFEEQRFEDARGILAGFAKRFPNNVIIRRLYGKVLVALKQYDLAVVQFRHILKVDSTFRKPYYFIGAALVLKGDPKSFPEAKKSLDHFIGIQDGTYWPASAHYWLGRLADKEGDKKLAKAEYKKAYKLDSRIKDALKKSRGLGAGM